MDQLHQKEGDATRQLELETDTAGTADFTGVPGTHAGSIILEASVTASGGARCRGGIHVCDVALRAGKTVSDVRVAEPVDSAAPAEAAPVEAPTGPAPPRAPAMADNSPLQAIGIVVHDDDDNRHVEVEITDDDGELDDKEEQAVQQDSYVATTGNTNLRGDDREYIRRY